MLYKYVIAERSVEESNLYYIHESEVELKYQTMYLDWSEKQNWSIWHWQSDYPVSECTTLKGLNE
jgi:hypothetical protein